jgi:hypothetical protein
VDVTLQYSEERKIENSNMRQFEIQMQLNNKLDIRDVSPMIKRNRVKDPMGKGTVSALPRREGG